MVNFLYLKVKFDPNLTHPTGDRTVKILMKVIVILLIFFIPSAPSAELRVQSAEYPSLNITCFCQIFTG